MKRKQMIRTAVCLMVLVSLIASMIFGIVGQYQVQPQIISDFEQLAV